jgi:hypothetical protein
MSIRSARAYLLSAAERAPEVSRVAGEASLPGRDDGVLAVAKIALTNRVRLAGIGTGAILAVARTVLSVRTRPAGIRAGVILAVVRAGLSTRT